MANDLFRIFLSGIHNQANVNDLVVIQISPKGTTYSSTPTYKWVAHELADQYCLEVWNNGQDMIDTCYTDSEANCNSGTCSVTPGTSLADGKAVWSIRALKGLKTGQFSNMHFIVSAGLPVAPTLISPTGTIYISTPTYKWFSLPNATSYWLQVDDPTGRGKIYKGYDASEVGCPSGAGTCSVTPGTSLAVGMRPGG